MTDVVTHAKQILRDAGYVVIPRERHVVLQIDRSVDAFLLETLRDADGRDGLLRYEERYAAEAMGHELMAKAVRRIDRGLSPDHQRYERRWEAEVILPQ